MRSDPATSTTAALAFTCRSVAQRLAGTAADFDPVLDLIGQARIVLLGEGSHGTHEFYRVRAEITKRLIRDAGFRAVAVEADWPDAHRVNRYVRGRGDDQDATEALAGFQRFPQWMWRNADVLDFVGWLRSWNDERKHDARAGFHGLDLYSLHRSMQEVVEHLRVIDPEAARRAQERYACFDDYGDDPQAYGHVAALELSAPCERAVLSQLVELQRSAAEYASRDGRLDPDHQFVAEQNARLVVDAEQYYRAMFRGRATSWNLRDRHMMSVLQALDAHLSRPKHAAKIVVWAHNSHLGDARSTHMVRAGEINLGQLVRERYEGESVSIGFTTFAGTVTAASDWGEPAERKVVRDALPGSWERLLHDVGMGNIFLDLRRLRAPWFASTSLLERAIGVIYRPETERASHYFPADLAHQFDAILHYDRTRAVEPLERTAGWEKGEFPETYPSAL